MATVSDDARRCASCEIEKPLSAFEKNRAQCKDCRAVYHRRWRSTQPTSGYQRSKYDRLRALINEAKSRPCADCGGSFPLVVMDLDHRDTSTKTSAVSRISYTSEARILAEIAQCDVVCANCHRIRTHRQREAGGFRKRRAAVRS